jgi:cytochrome c oxidase assembly protein subunit 15
MQEKSLESSSRPVAIWLLAGVGMIIIQVLLGGITRLTGSGLSITEWKPIMGALPPMNEHDWNIAFEKYKQIAFAIPFVIFIIQKRFKKDMIRPMLILFLLGALQGLVGWIMVQSGLEDSELVYVSHYKLAIHFILALVVLCYALWFALKLLIPDEQLSVNKPLKKLTGWLIALMTIQLIYGAFMAGLKAAPAAPTWPTINGVWFPENIHSLGNRTFNGLSFLTDNPLVVHFIHRSLAYVISVLVFIWFWKTNKSEGTPVFKKTKILPLLIVLLQVVLGVLTVLNAGNSHSFLWLAVAHQFVAMLLLLSLVWMIYLTKGKPAPAT